MSSSKLKKVKLQTMARVNNQGFTLIEIMVALVILAIAMTAVIYSIQSSIRTTNHVKDKMMAHIVAMNVMNTFHIGIQPPLEAEENRHLEKKWGNTDWHVTAYEDQSQNNYYMRIAIDVYHGDDKNRLEHLIGFVRVGQNYE